jgi:hypothetical protein
MHASPRVRNRSHVLEQSPHLGEAQSLVGFDRASTRTHEGDVVAQLNDSVDFLSTVRRRSKFDQQVMEKILQPIASNQNFGYRGYCDAPFCNRK